MRKEQNNKRTERGRGKRGDRGRGEEKECLFSCYGRREKGEEREGEIEKGG
jgi:hypothetical protein